MVAGLIAHMLVYVDVGEGPPLFLLHGYEWREIIPILAERYRVIASDLVGLGDTPVTLDQDYRLPNDVEMVRDLMDHLQIERADFVAHDHGGATVLLMMNSDPRRRSLSRARPRRSRDPSRVYGPAHRDARALAASAPLLHLAARFRAQQPDHGSIAGHARLPATRAAVAGRARREFRTAIARRLADDIPGVVGARWMQRSAHMPMLEEPEAYAESVVTFLERGEVGSDDFESAATMRATTQ